MKEEAPMRAEKLPIRKKEQISMLIKQRSELYEMIYRLDKRIGMLRREMIDDL